MAASPFVQIALASLARVRAGGCKNLKKAARRFFDVFNPFS
jgi:hypothetical protein